MQAAMAFVVLMVYRIFSVKEPVAIVLQRNASHVTNCFQVT